MRLVRNRTDDLIRAEFETLTKAVAASSMFKDEVAKLNIPEGFEVVVEPWPYGGKSTASMLQR